MEGCEGVVLALEVKIWGQGGGIHGSTVIFRVKPGDRGSRVIEGQAWLGWEGMGQCFPCIFLRRVCQGGKHTGIPVQPYLPVLGLRVGASSKLFQVISLVEAMVVARCGVGVGEGVVVK